MKSIFYSSFFIATLVGCAPSTDNLQPVDFSQKMNALNDEQILDVRTPEEFSQGHLAKAINIDWNDKDFSAKTVLVDKARPVMIYCQAGGRSAAAANKLREMGFTSVYELDGGMNAWNAANLPIEFPAIEKAKTTTSSLVIDKPTSKAVYLEEIKKDRYTLVDFTATWCGPCKIMAPRIDDLQQQMNGSFTVMKVDIDRDPEIADSMQVGSIPTLVMYKNGKQLWRHTGLLEKNSLEQMVKQEMK